MQIRTLLLLLFTATLLQMTATAQPFTGDENGVYTRRGYAITISKQRMDTQVVVDPVTGEEMQKIYVTDGKPEQVNGKKIYNPQEVTTGIHHAKDGMQVDQYIMSNIKGELQELELSKGVLRVSLSNILVDETGLIVYYEYNGIKFLGAEKMPRHVRDENIAPKIHKLMEGAAKMIPAKLNEEKVNSFIDSKWIDFSMEI